MMSLWSRSFAGFSDEDLLSALPGGLRTDVSLCLAAHVKRVLCVRVCVSVSVSVC